MDCSPPGSSVCGILQARILEWVAIPFSRDLPDLGIQPSSPALQADSLPSEPQGSPLVPCEYWTLWLYSCLLGGGWGWGFDTFWVPRFHGGSRASTWWQTGRPWGGEEPARSFPSSPPPGRHWGAKPHWVPSPDLELWEGDLAWVCIPSSRSGSLSGVVPTCSVHSVISRLVWPFVTLGYFPPKVQEMGKKNDFVYLLSVAFWTLIPGAAYRGPGRGLWHLFRHRGR